MFLCHPCSLPKKDIHWSLSHTGNRYIVFDTDYKIVSIKVDQKNGHEFILNLKNVPQTLLCVHAFCPFKTPLLTPLQTAVAHVYALFPAQHVGGGIDQLLKPPSFPFDSSGSSSLISYLRRSRQERLFSNRQ